MCTARITPRPAPPSPTAAAEQGLALCRGMKLPSEDEVVAALEAMQVCMRAWQGAPQFLFACGF